MEFTSVNGEGMAAVHPITTETVNQISDVLAKSCIGLTKAQRIGHTMSALLKVTNAAPDMPESMKSMIRDVMEGPPDAKTSHAEEAFKQRMIVERLASNGLEGISPRDLAAYHDLAIKLSQVVGGTLMRHLEVARWGNKVQVDGIVTYALIHTLLLLDADVDGDVKEFGGTCRNMFEAMSELKRKLPAAAE